VSQGLFNAPGCFAFSSAAVGARGDAALPPPCAARLVAFFSPPQTCPTCPSRFALLTIEHENEKQKNEKREKQDAFFARVGKQSVIQGAGLPAAAAGLKKVASGTPGLEELANVPLAVLAPLLGTFAQSVRALVPI